MSESGCGDAPLLDAPVDGTIVWLPSCKGLAVCFHFDSSNELHAALVFNRCLHLTEDAACDRGRALATDQ